MNKLFTKIAIAFVGLAMAVGVGVAIASSGKEASPVHAADPGSSIYTSGTPSFGTSYAGGATKTLNGVDWFFSNVGNNTSMGWNKSSQDHTDLGSGPLSNITQTSKIGSYQTSGAFSNAQKITVTVSNLDSVSGTWYIWYSTNGSSWTQGTTGTLGSSTTTFTYDHGSKIGASVYFAFGYGCSVTTKTRVNLSGIEVWQAASKTLSSISVSGYTTAFTVGDTFSFGGTVTAHYSDSTSANVTSSATFSGYNMSAAGNYTVTASYTEGGTTKTATYGITVSAATSPYITPAKASTSGYTGQNETLSFTYGNLTGSLGVSSSNTSVVTVETPSTSAGSGTVQINFVGAGSTTVKFKDGSTELASVSVSVTASSVTITGLAASAEVYLNKTLNLGSTITVTAVGIYSSDVTWESEDDDIATVTPAGVVTGVSEGEVDITVTSDDYPSATMTCTVTVSEQPPVDVLDSSVIPSAAVGSSTTSWGTATTFSDATGAVYTGRFMGVSSASFIGRLNDSVNGYIYTSTVPSGMKLKSVSIESMTASKTVGVYAQSGAYTGAPSDKSTALGTITPSSLSYTFEDESNYNAICLRGHTSATEIGTVTITYEALPELSSVTTTGQKVSFSYGEGFSYGGTLTAHYTKGKADAVKTPTKFKFGASGINPDSAGTVITEGTALSDTTHNGKYIYVGYTEGSITKWANYQISVAAPAAHYIVLSVETDTGTTYGYKNGVVSVDVTSSNLAGNITWTVTQGATTGAASDNSGYMATIASVGTLTITATDSGDGENTQSVSITVVDSLNAVMAPSLTEHASDLTFTAACEGSGTADDGATWTITSDAAESTYDSSRGIHYGTNSSARVQYVQLVSTDVASGASNTIKSVVVNASDAAASGSLTVTVGSTSFHCNGNTSTTVANNNPGTDYTFTGSASGTVTVKIDRGSAAYKGIYVKSIVVNYVTAGAESDIANAVDMHMAQKAVIDFAKDFNDDLEDICIAYGSTDTSDLEDKWDELVAKYMSWFTNSGKSLSQGEKDHAKALFANASSVDRNVTASADELQHMLAKYDWIVGHYSECEDFLNTDAGTGRDPVPHSGSNVMIKTILRNDNIIPVTVVISMLAATAVGAYFFFRKRKEEK